MQRESLKYYTRRYKRAGREGKKGKDGEREKMRPPPLSAKEKSTCPLWMSQWPRISARPWLSMEGEGESSVQAVQSHICTRWTRLLGDWTSGFGAALHGCAPGLSGQDARQRGGRSWCSFTQGPFDLPERVLNTMAEARAPSTRRLYALKWAIFSAWCQDRDVDPVTSDVSVVLSFLQEMLDKQRSSSTIKVYAAAIHAPIAGRSVGRNSAVVQFIRGARRLEPPVSSYSPTLGLTNRAKDLERPSVWTIAIHEPQFTLV